MAEGTTELGLVTLVAGAVIVLMILVKVGLGRLRLPPLLGYIFLGFLLNAANQSFELFPDGTSGVFRFMAEFGIFALLFRVGLKGDLPALLANLRHGVLIWAGNMAVCGGGGFAVAYWVFGLDGVQSAVVACALTATSVAIPVKVWDDAKAMDTGEGRLFLDVAELDDLSGVLLLVVLLAVLPALHEQAADALIVGSVLRTGGVAVVKLFVFGAMCYLFSRYVEPHMTAFFRRLEPEPDPMLLVVGVGLVIAATAELLGLSIAIGAFFAGLTFSRDPERIHLDASFSPLYELFTPFFFVAIGLGIQPDVLAGAAGLGFGLLALALATKLIGTYVPAVWFVGPGAALAISLSMAPRAEIFMLIVQRARELGDWAVTPETFAAMAFVSAATCALVPAPLHRLLRNRKWTHR